MPALYALLLALPLLSMATTAAATDSGLARCAQIADAGERLVCYDALAGRTPGIAVGAAGSAEAAPVPAAARFGAEQLPGVQASEETPPEQIRTRLIGRFTGWEAGTVFRLENGQAWRCVGCRPVFFAADSPQVTISRGVLGGYWLAVDGLNTRARVRRVE